MTAYLPLLSFPGRQRRAGTSWHSEKIIAVQAGRAAHRAFVFVS